MDGDDSTRGWNRLSDVPLTTEGTEREQEEELKEV